MTLSDSQASPSPESSIAAKASVDPPPSPRQALRMLFLTLFLRGRSSRGLQKKTAPSSIGRKLALTLLFYGCFGCIAFTFHGQPVFPLSVYLHSLTFILLGMFVASSAGEILFNKDEADILLHRPILPRTLLWAKIAVLVEVSLWIAGTLNGVGFFVGVTAPNGSLGFVGIHAISLVMEALFCTGCVVMVYQLCLRWFGRERLDGIMTTAQVIISVAAVLSGQILPRVVGNFEKLSDFHNVPWWIALLPPAWFAGVDDALAGSGTNISWLLGGFAVVAMGAVLWIAFAKLAHDYEVGLQTLNENVSRRKSKQKNRRWIDVLIEYPPLCWFLRSPVERASFLLATAYLTRDRDVKLRIYPGIAPMLVVPFLLLMPAGHPMGSGNSQFGIAFAGGYLGLVPLLGISMLQYSQQWQAADVFRVAPIFGPAPICHGARRAIMFLLVLPLAAVFALVAYFLPGDKSQLLLILPGVIALPVYAMIPNLGGKGVPLSMPTEEAKSAGRSLLMIGVIPIALALSGLASWAWSAGWFWWFIVGETIIVSALTTMMRHSMNRADWPTSE